MAEEEKKPADEGKLTVGALREMIRDEVAGLVSKVLPGGGTGTPPPGGDGTAKPEGGTGGGVTSEVQAALAALRKREEREARDKRVDELLEKSSKPAEEATPIERSRTHRFMGWGD